MSTTGKIHITSLTDHQKAVLWDIAVERHVIRQADVESYVSTIDQRVQSALNTLERIGTTSNLASVVAGEEIAPVPPMPKLPARANRKKRTRVRKVAKATSAKRDRTSVKPAIAPAQVASRKLQGKYLALIRQFPKAERPRWSDVVKTQGRKMAIRMMAEALAQHAATQS